MPCGFDVFGGFDGRGTRRPGVRRPKKRCFKGSKAAKKASRRR